MQKKKKDCFQREIKTPVEHKVIVELQNIDKTQFASPQCLSQEIFIEHIKVSCSLLGALAAQVLFLICQQYRKDDMYQPITDKEETTI